MGLKADGETDEGVEFRRGFGDAEVAAEIEHGVVADGVGEAHVHLADPGEARRVSGGGEKGGREFFHGGRRLRRESVRNKKVSPR